MSLFFFVDPTLEQRPAPTTYQVREEFFDEELYTDPQWSEVKKSVAIFQELVSQGYEPQRADTIYLSYQEEYPEGERVVYRVPSLAATVYRVGDALELVTDPNRYTQFPQPGRPRRLTDVPLELQEYPTWQGDSMPDVVERLSTLFPSPVWKDRAIYVSDDVTPPERPSFWTGFKMSAEVI